LSSRADDDEEEGDEDLGILDELWRLRESLPGSLVHVLRVVISSSRWPMTGFRGK